MVKSVLFVNVVVAVYAIQNGKSIKSM